MKELHAAIIGFHLCGATMLEMIGATLLPAEEIEKILRDYTNSKIK